MRVNWEQTEGSPFPFGVSWIASEQVFNFAVYSKHAESVELSFYGDDLGQPSHQFCFDYRRNKSGPIWHCRIAGESLDKCHFYAYRIAGPGPEPGFSWHAFDSEKLLLDPYAKAIFFPPDFDRKLAMEPGSNEGRAPLAVLSQPECPFDWSGDSKLRHSSDLVIYEMHVKGFTAHPSSGVHPENRGTFNGVIEKIPHLQKLGVTAVELMPVFQFDPQEGNYWGYMPINFFAPHNAYSSDPAACRQHDDFREMVKRFHAAGIEVILDVVYNHTAAKLGFRTGR